MTARGKILLCALDDGTTPREVSVFSRCSTTIVSVLWWMRFLIIEAKVSNDDFQGLSHRCRQVDDSRRGARSLRESLQLRLNGEVGEAGGGGGSRTSAKRADPFRDGGALFACAIAMAWPRATCPGGRTGGAAR